jgi:hypothetical protein
MRIRVESCWNGGKSLYFRLTLPDGSRETVGGERWTRSVASEALDLLEALYHLKRRSIRLDVR